MTLVDIVSTQGATPRGFRLRSERTLPLRGNQGSGSIVTFAVDPDRGTLTPTGAKVDVPRPVCVQLATI